MQLPAAVAPLCLTAAMVCYGASTLLLSRDVARSGTHPLRLGSYRAGLVGQAVAFGLAFVARATLPLLLVQAAVSASVAVSALGGWALRRWRLLPLDLVALVAVVTGIAAAGMASTPGPATLTSPRPVVVCLATTVLATGLGRARAGAMALGAWAGVAFGGSAVGARVLAADPSRAVRDLAGLLAAGLVVSGLVAGQVLLTRAFTRASVAGPVAAMYVAATVWPAGVGLVWLGDAVRPGFGVVAAAGVASALAGAARLARLEPHAAPDPGDRSGAQYR